MSEVQLGNGGKCGFEVSIALGHRALNGDFGGFWVSTSIKTAY